MERPVSSVRPLLIAAAAGGAVSLSAGVYGRLHAPTGQAIIDFGFPSVISMKAWLATGAFVLAMGQLTSALWMWGRLPLVGAKPRWLPTLHRWSGRPPSSSPCRWPTTASGRWASRRPTPGW